MTDQSDQLPNDQSPTERRVGNAIRWSALSQLVVRVVQTARGLVIARLIGPAAFGLFGSALLIASPLLLANDLGVGAYLVQRGARAREFAASAFWLATLAGVTASLLLVVAGVPLGHVLANSHTTEVTRGLALAVFLNAIGGVSTALLVAELRFRALALVQGASEVLGAAVGIALAHSGAGAWALVWAYVTSTGVTAGAGFVVARMGSAVRARGEVVRPWREMATFGGKLLAASLVWIVALQGDNFVVASALGVTALGFYAFAYNYGGVPGELGATVSRVAFPVLSHLKDSDEETQAQLRSFLEVAGIAVFAFGFIAMATAGPAVHLILGSRWTAAVTPLRLLLLMGMARGVSFAQVVFRARNRVDLELKAGLIAAPATVLAALIGSIFGVVGVAIAVASVMVANEITQSLLAFGLVGARPADGIRVLAQPALLMAIGCAPAVAALAWGSSVFPLAAGVIVAVACDGALARGLMPDAWSRLRLVVMGGSERA